MTELKNSEHALPAHADEAVSTIAEIHKAHERGASRLDRIADGLMAYVGRPVFLIYIIVAIACWFLLAATADAMGYRWVDPLPFPLLDLGLAIAAILIAVLILASQRRADRLAIQREHMTLQTALQTEQKVSKVIELLEELRRDLPDVRNRVDLDALEMVSKPDPAAVLDAIKKKTK